MSDRKNEEKYPELYRKSEYVKGSNLDVPMPFQIGECWLVVVGHLSWSCDYHSAGHMIIELRVDIVYLVIVHLVP